MHHNLPLTMDPGRKNQHISSYLYTLTVLIGITVNSVSVNEVQHVKIEKHFSYSIACEHIVNIHGVAVQRCVDECLSRTRCGSVNYIVRHNYCELCANNDTSGKTRSNGSLYIFIHGMDQENVPQKCNCSARQTCRTNAGAFQCQTEECETPPSLGDRTKIIGNRRQKGSTIKYFCEVHLTGYLYKGIQSECQENGEWTAPNTSCTNPVYQGCYTDIKSRVLIASTIFSHSKMTHELCETRCIKDAYVYFGLERYTQCFCGDVLPSSNMIVSQNECNDRCRGNHQQMCGGFWRISIYKTIY